MGTGCRTRHFGRRINDSGFRGHFPSIPRDYMSSQHFLREWHPQCPGHHRTRATVRPPPRPHIVRLFAVRGQRCQIACGTSASRPMLKLVGCSVQLMARRGELRGALPAFGDGSVWTTTAPRHDYAQSGGGLAPWQLRRAQHMLLANIESNLPLRHVSDACRLSASHFARAFKISTGLSPLKWLIASRIDLSKRTLISSDISLVDVAAMYGFSDQSHFSRVFHRVVGRSPGAWRREYRDENRFPESRSTVGWIDFISARNGRRDA